MKYIYIVLIKAHTGLGSIARLATGYEYTHAAVCLDKKLEDFISYSRRRHYLPFDAGFTHEKRDFYAFGKHRNVKVRLFRLPADDEHYSKVMDFISLCENDSEQMFNLFSMITMPIIHGFEIYKAHNCMSIVTKIAELSGAVQPKRSCYKYNIMEIDKMLENYFFAEGYLKRKPSEEYYKYMEIPSFCDYLHYGTEMITELVKRMIYNRRGG